jgi:hypothetical protein
MNRAPSAGTRAQLVTRELCQIAPSSQVLLETGDALGSSKLSLECTLNTNRLNSRFAADSAISYISEQSI